MPTIGTGMIVRNEDAIIFRTLENIIVFSDLVCVIDTGSTDSTVAEIERFIKNHPEGAKVMVLQYLGASEQDETGDWKLWDFAKARNRYVEILDPMVDYIFWMDADDTVVNPQGMRCLLPDELPETPRIWTMSITSGGLTWTHHRLFQTKHGASWKYPVHEYLQFAGFEGFESDIRISHAHHEAAHKECSEPRNLRILRRVYESGTISPRELFYMANTLKDCQQYVEAIKIYDEYLNYKTETPFHDEMMFAHLYKTRCYRYVGMTGMAINSAFIGLARDNRYSELWVELCYGFNQEGRKNMARACAMAAIQPAPPTQLFQEPMCYDAEPARLLKYTV